MYVNIHDRSVIDIIGEDWYNKWKSVGEINGYFLSKSKEDFLVWGNYKSSLPIFVRMLHSYVLYKDDVVLQSGTFDSVDEFERVIKSLSSEKVAVDTYNSLVIVKSYGDKDYCVIVPLAFALQYYSLCGEMLSELGEFKAFTTIGVVERNLYQLFAETCIGYTVHDDGGVTPITFVLYGETTSEVIRCVELLDSVDSLDLLDNRLYTRLFDKLTASEFLDASMDHDGIVIIRCTVKDKSVVEFAYNWRSCRINRISKASFLRNVMSSHHWYIYSDTIDDASYNMEPFKQYLLGHQGWFDTKRLSVSMVTNNTGNAGDLSALLDASNFM